MKRNRLVAVLAASLLAILPSTGLPQIQIPSRMDIPLMVGYDLSATSYTYCAVSNVLSGPGRITTSGSSTTVTRPSTDTTSEPFTGLVVGDEIDPVGPTPLGTSPQTIGGNPLTRYITVITNTHQVTVNSAVDLSGGPGGSYAWKFRTYGSYGGAADNTRCGTTINFGWVPLPTGPNTVAITATSSSGVATLTYSIEGVSRGGGPFEGPTQLFTGTFTSFSAVISGGPEASTHIPIGEDVAMLRVGVKVNAGSARVNVILSNGGQ